MLLKPWSSFQGRATRVPCNLVQVPQPDHSKTPHRVCRARQDVCQDTPGLRDTTGTPMERWRWGGGCHHTAFQVWRVPG